MSQENHSMPRSSWSRAAGGLAVTALVSALLTGCGASTEEMLGSAKDYIAKNDLTAASIQLKNALQEDGSLTEARFLLGKINLQQGEIPGAVKELRRASELGHAREEVIPLLLQAMVRAGEFDAVLKEFEGTRLPDARAQAVVFGALGDAHFGKGDVDKALKAYRDAIAADPAQADARVGLARALLVKGELDAAEAQARDAIARAEAHAEAHAVLSDILVSKGDLDAAVQALQAALKASPGTVHYHFNHVSLLMRKGQFEEAERALAAMQSVAAAHPTTRYLRAFMDYRAERLSEARDGLMQVLKQAPNYLPAELLAGTVMVRMNEHVLGRTHLGRVLERAPGQLMARQMLIASHLATGDATRALELLQPMLQMPDPSPRVLALAGQVFIANNDYQRAEEYFAKAAEAAPEDARARLRLGVARMASGDADAAFADLESAAQMDQAAIQADLALVVAHLRRGEADKALEAQLQLEQKQPDNPLVHNLRGGLMLAKRDVPAARAAFEKALALQPGYLAAAVNLARLDLAERQPEGALARIRAVIQRDPRNVEAHLALAELQRATGAAAAEVLATLERADGAAPGGVAASLALVSHHLQQREFPRALQVAQKLAAAHPDEVRAVEALARAQVAAGDSQQGISSLNRLAGLMPRSPQPHLFLAEVYTMLGDKTAAEQSLRRALSIAPAAVDIQQRLIAAVMARGDAAEALRIARDIQAGQPDAPIGYFFEAEIHGVGRDWKAAEAAFRKALERNGGAQVVSRLHTVLLLAERKAEADRLAADWLQKNPTDIAVRGYLAERALVDGRHRDAHDLFARMHEMAPQNALILNNLAWTASQVKDPKAFEYAEQALRLAPDNPAIIDTVGMIQVERGDFDAGVTNLERAVKLGPDLLPLHLNLARAYVKAGRANDARSQLDALLPRLKDGTPIHAEASELRKSL